MRIVLDTPAAANVVFKADKAPELIGLLERAEQVIAPALMRSEMGNALLKSAHFAALETSVALTQIFH